MTGGENEDEKEIPEKDLEKRGFHNVDEEIEKLKQKEQKEKDKINLYEEDNDVINNTFSEEDSIREELRYKLHK